MRLTQRPVNDIERVNLMTFSGTATRLAQTFVVSEACCRQHQGWRLATVDVKKAFLKGITYKELAELTGEPFRILNFEFDPERWQC